MCVLHNIFYDQRRIQNKFYLWQNIKSALFKSLAIIISKKKKKLFHKTKIDKKNLINV